MYYGGIRLLEITFDASGKTSDEGTAENIQMLKNHFGDEMHISYPDADFYDGKIYMVYDHDRVLDREILLLTFTEDDIKNPDCVLTPQIIARPELSVEDIEKLLKQKSS